MGFTFYYFKILRDFITRFRQLYFSYISSAYRFCGFLPDLEFRQVRGLSDFIGALSVNHLFSIIHRRMNLGGPWLTFRQLLALTKGCIIADCWRRVWRGR